MVFVKTRQHFLPDTACHCWYMVNVGFVNHGSHRLRHIAFCKLVEAVHIPEMVQIKYRPQCVTKLSNRSTVCHQCRGLVKGRALRGGKRVANFRVKKNIDTLFVSKSLLNFFSSLRRTEIIAFSYVQSHRTIDFARQIKILFNTDRIVANGHINTAVGCCKIGELTTEAVAQRTNTTCGRAHGTNRSNCCGHILNGFRHIEFLVITKCLAEIILTVAQLDARLHAPE